MKHRLRQWLPSPESIHRNRWLRWLGPALHHPRLWHFSRKGIALGLALGIFFGFLVPVAQIPLSAAAAVAMRANLPMAVASTLVTNPVTFGPVYFAAYKTGQHVLGRSESASAGPATPSATPAKHETEQTWGEWLTATWDWLGNAGKPLVVGLALFACTGGLLAYALTSLAWAWYVRRNRARRLAQRRTARAE
jgi:uncharacterized protein (DUF2062 family)